MYPAQIERSQAAQNREQKIRINIVAFVIVLSVKTVVKSSSNRQIRVKKLMGLLNQSE